jgi:tRNA (mo5U34)-methyltransferase
VPESRKPAVSKEEIHRRLAAVRWHHRFQIAPGIETPGAFPIDASYYLDCLRIPRDLRGKSAIDIGTYDGPIAFELERRGADVVALDIHDPARSGFAIARELLGSRVPYIRAHRGVYDLPDAVGRQFDLVFFLGVFYHLKNPIEAFEHIAQIMHSGSRLYFEGETLYRYAEDSQQRPVVSPILEQLAQADIPVTLCYPGTLIKQSNWFIPNVACLKGWLRASGFEVLEINSMSFPDKVPPQQRTAGIARKISESPVIEHDFR